MVKENKNSRKRNKALFLLTLILLFLSGIAILLIPTVESHVLAYKQAQIIETIDDESDEKREKGSNTLSVAEAELGDPIAILKIPSLKLTLPVFQGTSNEILDKGIGLIDGTGDINGGKGRNPVLSGHNGLSTANLFTDLPKIKNTAKFFVKVDGEYHEYEVEKQRTVVGTDLEQYPEKYLMPEQDKDEMTLMTCVPRYINNKRLLVTGYRIPFNKADLEESDDKKDQDSIVLGKNLNDLKPFIFGGVLMIIVLLICLIIKKYLDKQRTKEGNDDEQGI